MQFRIKQIIATLSLFAAVLLPSSAIAEQQDGCLKLKELGTVYNAIAKGTSMPVQLKFKTHDCRLSVGSSAADVSLTAAAAAGFDLNTHYQRYNGITSSTSGTADGIELTVVVTTSEHLSPGKYQVPAVLNYQAIDKEGNLRQESTALVIPVKVVNSATEVKFRERPDHWKPLKTAGIVAVVIVLVPIALVVQLVTGIQILSDC